MGSPDRQIFESIFSLFHGIFGAFSQGNLFMDMSQMVEVTH